MPPPRAVSPGLTSHAGCRQEEPSLSVSSEEGTSLISDALSPAVLEPTLERRGRQSIAPSPRAGGGRTPPPARWVDVVALFSQTQGSLAGPGFMLEGHTGARSGYVAPLSTGHRGDLKPSLLCPGPEGPCRRPRGQAWHQQGFVSLASSPWSLQRFLFPLVVLPLEMHFILLTPQAPQRLEAGEAEPTTGLSAHHPHPQRLCGGQSQAQVRREGARRGDHLFAHPSDTGQRCLPVTQLSCSMGPVQPRSAAGTATSRQGPTAKSPEPGPRVPNAHGGAWSHQNSEGADGPSLHSWGEILGPTRMEAAWQGMWGKRHLGRTAGERWGGRVWGRQKTR